jgi:hypothetical protein
MLCAVLNTPPITSWLLQMSVAVLTIQRAMPLSRVVYCSATGVTGGLPSWEWHTACSVVPFFLEGGRISLHGHCGPNPNPNPKPQKDLSHLAFMERLGLWGPGIGCLCAVVWIEVTQTKRSQTTICEPSQIHVCDLENLCFLSHPLVIRCNSDFKRE